MQSFRKSVQRVSVARKVTPTSASQPPLVENLIQLIEQSKRVFDALSREENDNNRGLIISSIFEVKIPAQDNDTVSLDSLFRGLRLIFRTSTPSNDEIETIIEEFDADFTGKHSQCSHLMSHSGWTDFPSFLTVAILVWYRELRLKAKEPADEDLVVLQNLPVQLRQARKAFYLADTDEDGCVNQFFSALHLL